MTRELRHPAQRVRLEHGRRTPADPITDGSETVGPAAWLRLQRDAGNKAVVAAMHETTRNSETTVQRKGGDDEAAQDGSTALIAATRAGDEREVRKLLRRKAPVNQPDSHGTTALIYAADRRSVSLAVLLLDAGADPNYVSTETSDDGSVGDTALKVAVTQNDPTMASLLMARGARMEVRDRTGLTTPAWAARRGSLSCLSLFLGAGWPINHVDHDGFTLLTWAATGGQLATAQYLIATGIDATKIPAVLVAAKRQSAAYAWQASDLASRQVPPEEVPAIKNAIAAALGKGAAVDEVIAYLEQLVANEVPE